MSWQIISMVITAACSLLSYSWYDIISILVVSARRLLIPPRRLLKTSTL